MSDYKDSVNKAIGKKVDGIMEELPDCARRFLKQKAGAGKAEKTLLAYAQDLQGYFRYLCENNAYFAEKGVPGITSEDLSQMKAEDAAEFLMSLRQLKLATQKHYRTVLNQFYKFLVQMDEVPKNPFELIPISRKETADLHFLDIEEQAAFMDAVVNQGTLSDRQRLTSEKNQVRDTAICFLFLSTGIRVSELVGLDITDLDLKHHKFRVTRKGAREHTEDVYVSDRAQTLLEDYLQIRKDRYSPLPSDQALFLTEGRRIRKDGSTERIRQPGHRISVKTVERLVKKYVDASVPEKAGQITPHKLRTTFAENVLQKTGNLELTKDLLGHRNIASTTHYVTTTEKEKEEARNLMEP